MKYLKRDYLTDVITFDNSDTADQIDADIFISYERILDNAKKFKTRIEEELRRVIIHGVLHAVGYEDSSDSEKDQMRETENRYLSLF